MSELTRKSLPARLRKDELLGDAPLFINRVTVETVYSPEDSLSQLHVHDFVEVSIVTAGRGIHRTPDGCAECGAGDTYVIGAGVPHAYFAAEDGERPRCAIWSLTPPSSLRERPLTPTAPATATAFSARIL